MAPTPITTKRGNTSNVCKPLITQHIINLQECDVFYMLVSIGEDSQNGTNENQMRIDKMIDKESHG